MNFYFTTPWLALGNGAERLADLNLFFYLYNNLNINYDFYIDQFLNLEFFINCGAISSTLVTLGQPAGLKKKVNSILSGPGYNNSALFFYSYVQNQEISESVTSPGGSDLNSKEINNYFSSNKLAPYLAGLIEGDGSIFTPVIDNTKTIKGVPHIEIAFDIRDLPLFEKIRSIIGGFITIRPNGNSGRLTVKKKRCFSKIG